MTLSFNSAFIPFKICSGKIWKLLTFRGRYSHLVVKLVEIAWILQLAFLPSCFPFQLIPQTQYKFFMLFNALSCVTLVLKNKIIEYEFYCAVEKFSTRCNPKMYRRCFTSPWDWCKIFPLSFLAKISATLSTNQMQDDNQSRLSYSHPPALQIRYSFYAEALLAHWDVSSVLICWCDYFFNDSDDWLLWLLFYDIEMKCS